MSPRTTATIVALGLLFGATTALANYGQLPGAPYTAKIISSNWGWLTAGLLAALAGTTWRRAMRRAWTFLLAAVAAYYALELNAGAYSADLSAETAAELGFRGSSGGIDVVADILMYVVVSAAAAAIAATVVTVVRHGRPLPALAAALTIPIYFIYSGRDIASYTLDDPAMVATANAAALLGVLGVIVVVAYAALRHTAAKSTRHETAIATR